MSLKISQRFILISCTLLTFSCSCRVVVAQSIPTESISNNAPSQVNIFDAFLPSQQDINGLIGDIKGLVKDLLKGDFSRFASVFQGRFFSYLSRIFDTGLELVYSEVAGVLGLPDPQLLEDIVKGDLDSVIDLALETAIDLALPGGNSPEIQEKVSTDLIISLADGVADSTILSQEAQQQNLARLEKVESITNSSVELAADSQTKDISQDILKNISQQTASSQTLQGAIYSEINSSRVDRAIANKVLARILRETQNNNFRKMREKAATGRLLVNQATYVMPGLITVDENK